MDNDNNYYQSEQPQYQQPSYQQPEYQPPMYQEDRDPNKSVMTMGDWVIVLLIECIPCVNIIMLFVWAFGSNSNENKSNYAKANLIFMAIGIVLSIIFYFTIFAALMAQYNVN